MTITDQLGLGNTKLCGKFICPFYSFINDRHVKILFSFSMTTKISIEREISSLF